jgi:mRNA interferase MazF
LGTVNTVVVAQITKNLMLANDPSCLFIDISTSDGKATGMVHDSVVTCLQLATVYTHTIAQVLGKLSPTLSHKLDECLRNSLGLS